MDWLRFFFALAFVSFRFVYGVEDNSKEDNAKRKLEVVEELKLKYSVGGKPKMKYVQIAGRNFSVIPTVYSRARMTFCRSMPTTVYFVTTA